MNHHWIAKIHVSHSINNFRATFICSRWWTVLLSGCQTQQIPRYEKCCFNFSWRLYYAHLRKCGKKVWKPVCWTGNKRTVSIIGSVRLSPPQLSNVGQWTAKEYSKNYIIWQGQLMYLILFIGRLFEEWRFYKILLQ